MRERAKLVSFTVAIALAIFVTKLILASPRFSGQGEASPHTLLRMVGSTAVCCVEDTLLALSLWFAVSWLQSLPLGVWYRRALQCGYYLAGLAVLVLLAVEAHVFAVFQCFLNANHLELIDGLRAERSVIDSLTPAVKLTLLGVPLATLTVHLVWMRLRLWQALGRHLCRPAVVTLVAALLLGGRVLGRPLLAGMPHDLTRNPHCLLACSFFKSTPALSGSVGDDEEFRPAQVSERVVLTRRPKNIVLIVGESLSAPCLSLYGGPFAVTPELERRQGVVFDNFYATANNSIASGLPLFASTYNDVHHVATVWKQPDFPVPAAAQWLKSLGYSNYFLGAGGGRCWEKYLNMLSAYIDNGGFDLRRDLNHPFWQRADDPKRLLRDDYLDDQLFEDATRLIRDIRDERFFLVLWNYGTHYPYRPGPASANLTFDDACFPTAPRQEPDKHQWFTDYLRSIHNFDHLVGSFCDELKRLHLDEDTLVVVTGDHGESWGDHGFLMHTQTIFEEEVRVPLVMLSPHLTQLGPRSPTLGSHIDLWPTIMDICDLPCDPRWQGRSLFDRDTSRTRRAYFYGANFVGLREGKYKYIWDGRRKKRLIDLDTDPGERNNLARQEPELCARFEERLRTWANYQTTLVRDRIAGNP
jgi:arylsulfatase A-like enzyme